MSPVAYLFPLLFVALAAVVFTAYEVQRVRLNRLVARTQLAHFASNRAEVYDAWVAARLGAPEYAFHDLHVVRLLSWVEQEAHLVREPVEVGLLLSVQERLLAELA